MPRYPAPPPLRLPDGTLVPVGVAGTQFIEDDGTSYQPVQGTPPVPERERRTAGGYRTYNPAPITSVAGPSVPAAAPAAPLVPGKVAALANTVGAAVKKNPLGALNAGLGLAGALQYATAQAPPMLGRPDPYAPMIRPAQGLNATSLEAGRRGIQAAQTQAGRATGADTGTTAVTRLLAQQQAGEQQGVLSLKDNEAFQTDQRRVDEQTNQAYQANYTTQRSFAEKRYDLQQRQFEARRQQSGAMAAGAYQYFVQDQAGKREDANRAEEMAEMKRLNLSPADYYGGRSQKKKTAATTTSTTGQVKSEARGGQLPQAPDLFGRGGRLKTSTTTKTSSSFGRGHQAARNAFSERMDKLTLQAKQAFDQSLREASNKRARGFSGR